MIGVPTALLLGTVLLLLLLLMAARASAAAREVSSTSDAPLLEEEAGLDLCPAEFVSRIFGSDDWEFVSNTNSRQLQEFFRRERKLVALVWVHQTSTAIRRIMRQHTEATRQSHDLHFATETRLVLLYAELMLICGLLFLAIQAAGPQRVRGLAVYAGALSGRLAQAQHDFQAVATGREFRGFESS